MVPKLIWYGFLLYANVINFLRMQDLRRKLPVTRTLFPWHNTLQFSLTRDIQKNLGLENSE